MGLNTLIVCTDGSDAAREAASAGFAILQPAEEVIVVTVVELLDEMTVTGTGIASGTLTPAQFDEADRTAEMEGRRVVEETAAVLTPAPVELQVLRGEPGPMLCDFAHQVSADALVMGSRGLGRIKRAVLGSVSDYVVRSAACPVVISGPKD
jgi:nucleotide-binding universal stress UspA family protein